MESASQTRKQPKAVKLYLLIITILGGAALALAVFGLPMPRLDLRFLLLTAITILVSSRIAIQIPRANVEVTVTDTFIFLVLLLYGGSAGIVIAAIEGLFSALRTSKKPLTVLFNSSMMACSTMLTVTVVSAAFGPVDQLRFHEASQFIAAVSTMTLFQYFSTTGLAAIVLALKTRESIWCVWQKHCLWTSITYLGGAAIATAVVNIVDRVGFVTFLIAAPIIGIIYFIYRKYLGKITATAVQAEQADHLRAQAEHARTAAERERAEQAERHVEELSRHIAEQQRISEQLRESKEHFRHAAFHDALTNLPNRALLTENLRFAIERAKQHEAHQFAVLLLDLDRFKNVNDSLGHSHGDQLLIATARRLESCIRECDMVARLSGDEFAILVDDIPDIDAATDMARRIQEKLQSPFDVSGHEVFTTVSIGIALSATGYDRPENMLRDADTAMYRAKAKGKACYQVFDKGMHTNAVFLLQMETDLRRALERDELRVHYQPIVSLDDGHLAGFEALVRWEHPERGVMSPADFIPMAEDTGLIVPLGAFVLRRACQQVSKWHWQSMANRSLFVSVNVSGRQLARPNLVSEIRAILEETHVEPKHLKLEITESAVMENAETAVQLLTQLKAMGVHSIMDDFGTGQSSLGYLHRFPLSTLKIDRSFVGRIGDVAENIQIVRSIIYLAETMGIQVVAEGVETLNQLIQLRQLGCHYGQGYLFSRPVEAESISEWISRRPLWQEALFKEIRTMPQNQGLVNLRSA